MEFQTLKNGRSKKIVLGVLSFVIVLSIIIFRVSYASYRTTQSINIANGKINYKLPDLRMVAIKLQDEEDDTIYNDSDIIPTSGYRLNSEKSICGQPDGNGGATKDNDITITYDEDGIHFNTLKKNTRCYLYFDKISDGKLWIFKDGKYQNITGFSNPSTLTTGQISITNNALKLGYSGSTYNYLSSNETFDFSIYSKVVIYIEEYSSDSMNSPSYEGQYVELGYWCGSHNCAIRYGFSPSKNGTGEIIVPISEFNINDAGYEPDLTNARFILYYNHQCGILIKYLYLE